eukprot:TRINITY_DN46815_c0_g1_i1.p1 TRINITY_DN46815_c0_g1~~TRINITY_DN46815_c0_g1_i1.p1  ORF type:complete len:760 (+),score=203.32 TRINITY_DN46815_c0_g1_i1:82-2280(+)
MQPHGGCAPLSPRSLYSTIAPTEPSPHRRADGVSPSAASVPQRDAVASLPSPVLDAAPAPLTPQTERCLEQLRLLASALLNSEGFDPTDHEWRQLRDEDRDSDDASQTSTSSSADSQAKDIGAVAPLLVPGATGLRLRVPPVPRAQRAVVNILRTVGKRLLDAVVGTAACIEEQMLLVFAQHERLRTQIESEAEVMRKHRWSLRDDGRPPPDAKGLPSASRMPGPPATPPPPQRPPAAAPPPERAPQRRAARAAPQLRDTLSAHLYLCLEELTEVTQAERGSLLLYQQLPDGAQVLRCGARVPAAANLATDDVPALGSTFAATVWQTGIAISSASADPTVPGSKSRPRQVLAIPVPAHPRHRHPIGVLVLQNKRGQAEGRGFSSADEATVVSVCRQLSLSYARYPAHLWHGGRGDHCALRDAATPLAPEASDKTREQLLGDETAEHGRNAPSRYGHMQLDDTQYIYYVRGKDTVLPREMAGRRQPVLSHAAELKECGRYVRSLEHMWRNALADGAELRYMVQELEERCAMREKDCAALEQSLRDMARNCAQLKEEMAMLRKQADNAAAAATREYETSVSGGTLRAKSPRPPMADVLPTRSGVLAGVSKAAASRRTSDRGSQGGRGRSRSAAGMIGVLSSVVAFKRVKQRKRQTPGSGSEHVPSPPLPLEKHTPAPLGPSAAAAAGNPSPSPKSLSGARGASGRWVTEGKGDHTRGEALPPLPQGPRGRVQLT